MPAGRRGARPRNRLRAPTARNRLRNYSAPASPPPSRLLRTPPPPPPEFRQAWGAAGNFRGTGISSPRRSGFFTGPRNAGRAWLLQFATVERTRVNSLFDLNSYFLKDYHFADLDVFQKPDIHRWGSRAGTFRHFAPAARRFLFAAPAGASTARKKYLPPPGLRRRAPRPGTGPREPVRGRREMSKTIQKRKKYHFFKINPPGLGPTASPEDRRGARGSFRGLPGASVFRGSGALTRF
jgi:hypothetical protein